MAYVTITSEYLRRATRCAFSEAFGFAAGFSRLHSDKSLADQFELNLAGARAMGVSVHDARTFEAFGAAMIAALVGAYGSTHGPACAAIAFFRAMHSENDADHTMEAAREFYREAWEYRIGHEAEFAAAAHEVRS